MFLIVVDAHSKVVGCHSHEDCYNSHNSRKTVDTILKILSTTIDCLRQWFTVCGSRISKILQEKWDSTHPYCTILPGIERPGRTSCANIQERLQEILGMDCGR